MKTTSERLQDLFNLSDKKEIAKEINDLLDDFASTITTKLEREFYFKNTDGVSLGSSGYVSPPRTGDHLIIGGTEYLIKKVTHAANSNNIGIITLQEI